MTKRNVLLGCAAIMLCTGTCLIFWTEPLLSTIAYNTKVESVDGKELEKYKIIIPRINNQPRYELHEAIFKIQSQLRWSKFLLFVSSIILINLARNPDKPKEIIKASAKDTDLPYTKTPLV